MLLGIFVHAQKVLVIKGDAKGNSSKQAEYNRYTSKVENRLKKIGIEFETASESHLTMASFADVKVALLPYSSSSMPDESWNQLSAFIEGGGKIGVFYSHDERLDKYLGVNNLQFSMKLRELGVTGVRFEADAIQGIPEIMNQNSGNLLVPELKDGARVIGQWIDGKGKDVGYPATILTQYGFFFTHVYFDSDAANGGRFLTSFIGQYIPEVWCNMAKASLENVFRHGACTNAKELSLLVQMNHNAEADKLMYDSSKTYENAQQAFAAGKYIKAIELAEKAEGDAQRAFMLTVPSRAGELRGAWIHTAYGVRGLGWDETIRQLSENGFNAIFVNMCWGYVADYNSEVLPVHPDVEQKGDQIEQCLNACRKYGVELHVWKVCWNMGNRTPEALVKKMQDGQRTQKTSNGSNTRYLAPHIPENFDLERRALLEIVSRYKVDGIHFDYIRYPDSNTDYSDSARYAFELAIGRKVEKWPDDCRAAGKDYSEFLKWRRGNITRLVETVYKEAKEIRKDIKVSAAVFSDWEGAREWVGQDAADWIEKGYLDFVCPMDYETDDAVFSKRLLKQVAAVQGKVPVYPGIGSYLMTKHSNIANQIVIARNNGADGFVCFDLNPNFTANSLPVLHLGATAVPAGKLLPHHSPTVQFKVMPGRKELFGQYQLGDKCSLDVKLPQGMQTGRNIRATIEVNGVQISAEKCEIKSQNILKGIRYTFQPELPGSYRVCLRNEKQSLLVRSPVMKVLGEKEVDECMLKQGPPIYNGDGGIKVALWHNDSYGAKTMLKTLQAMPDVNVAILNNFKPENLRETQVIVIPQPRHDISMFKEKQFAEAIAGFVKNGGGLLVTHTMVGVRGMPNLVPSVVIRTKPAIINTSEWKVVVKHPVTENISSDFSSSTFVDMVGFEVAKNAVKLAVAKDGAAILAAGRFGKGRYVPCGLGLAIGRGDVDCEFSPDELALFQNAVRWLGKGN